MLLTALLVAGHHAMQGLQVDYCRFDLAAHRVEVVDHMDQSQDIPDVLAPLRYVAGINGGFFAADRSLVGLVVSHGKVLQPLSTASLLTGVVWQGPRGMCVERVAGFKRARGVRDALQCGPFLVEGFKPVPGLERTRPARRTAVAVDDKGHGAFLASDEVTLAAWARLLSRPGVVPGMRIQRALSLDGGSSTIFWTKEPPLYRRGSPEVRNFLALTAGKPPRGAGSRR